MLKNYFLVAWRNLIRKKSFSFLNITGLSIGMASAVLIVLWIQHELNFDQFHPDIDRIYQVYNKYNKGEGISVWNSTPKPMAAAIQADYPEVEKVTRVNYSFPMLISLDEKRISSRGSIVDSTFLQVFKFPLLKGNAAQVLQDPHSIVITESLAAKLFDGADPIGKIVKLDNAYNFTVTGVLKDRPANTRFEFNFLVPWAILREMGGDDEFWSNNSVASYVLLKNKNSLASIAPKLKTLREKYDKKDPKMETMLYPFSRTYLHGNFENGIETGGRVEMVRLFAIIALLILLVACINFMNLSTARSEKRAREVGIRKVVGARRGALLAQFLGESVLLTMIAAVLALGIIQISLPAFNKLVNKPLALHFNDYRFWMASLGFILFTGLLAGSYPAFYLSGFKPVKVIKGAFKSGKSLATPRKILVIGQFTFAIVLIIATIVVYQQMRNAQLRQTGYDRDQLIYNFIEGDVEKNYVNIKRELLSKGYASSVAKTSSPITEGWSNTWAIGWEGKDPNDRRVMNRFCADDAVAKTLGLQIIQGRDIDLEKFPTDSNAALLNESAVKLIGFKDPIGKTLQDMGQDWTIVGVVKDFILNSPYQPMEPSFIAGAKGFFNVIHIKLSKDRPVSESLAGIASIFKTYNPEYEFYYHFASEEYVKKFSDEKRTATLASLFALLTILISCLGLFGLASYIAESRFREIGVRKVLGASTASLAGLLSRDFLKLVLIAFVIATPLGYWAMYSWLQNFPYRINISWWVLLLSGVIAVFIALITVSFQAIRAALANPVKSLRSE